VVAAAVDGAVSMVRDLVGDQVTTGRGT
jgi:hypothetical protein